jgi:adenosine deaminase
MFVDLHVHLRGTINPQLAARLAKRNRLAEPKKLTEMRPPHKWRNFDQFLKAYDDVTSVVRTATDLEEIAYIYLCSSAKVGTIYVEFMLSPPDLIEHGISFEQQLVALEAAWVRSRRDCGIESRLIVTAVRHHGPLAARDVAEMVATTRHPYLVGFGLVGDEASFETREFVSAFDIAKNAGMKLTAHSGEHRPAASIPEAVRLLSLDRVGHGVRAVEDREVLAFIAERGIGLEICISSNLALGLYKNLMNHPLPQLINSGISVSLGTDDPAFFGTTPAKEYELAEKSCAGIANISQRISEDAVKMAFCDEEMKRLLLVRLAPA